MDIKLENILGNKTSNLNTTDKVGVDIKISMPTPQYYMKEGAESARAIKFDSEPYRDILDNQDIKKSGLEALDELRAQNQGAWRLVGNAVGQFGTTLVADAVSGLGGILKTGEAAWDITRSIWDETAKLDFGNSMDEGIGGMLLELGKELSESGRNIFPIYQTKKAQKGGIAGGMADRTWWASMFPTVASAAASMVPVVSALKGVSYVGKLAQLASTSSKLGRLSNTLGRGLQSKTLQTILGAVFGGHLDVYQEIAHGRDEQIAYAKSLGMSDEDAVNFASEYAAEAYKDGIAYGLIFNLIELNALLKTPDNLLTTVKAQKYLEEGIDALRKKGSKATFGKIDDIHLSKAGYFKSFGKRGGDLFKGSLAEGFEEMRVDLALQEGEVKAREKYGIEDYRSQMSEAGRWIDLISKANTWDSFIWGALGGGTMILTKAAPQAILYGKDIQKYEADRVTNILNSLQKTLQAIEVSDGSFDLTISDKEETITNPDGTTSKITRPVLNRSVEELLPTIISLSGDSNSYVYAKNLLQSLTELPDDEFAKIYGDANKKGQVEVLHKLFDKAAQVINKNRNINVDPEVAPMVRKSLNTKDFMLWYYTDQRNKVQTELKRLHKLRERYNLKDIDNKLESLDTDKTKYTDKISSLNDDINTLDSQISAVESQLVDVDKTLVDLENESILTNTEIHNKEKQLQDLYSKSRIARGRIFQLSREGKSNRTKSMREARNEFKSINQQIANLESEIGSLNDSLYTGLTSISYQAKTLESDKVVLNSRAKELKSRREGLINELNDSQSILNTINEDIKSHREAQPRLAQEYDIAKSKNQTENIDAQNKDEENLIELNDYLNRTINGLERELTTDRKKTISEAETASKGFLKEIQELRKVEEESKKKEEEAEKRKEKEEKKKQRTSKEETIDESNDSKDEVIPVDTTATDEEFDDNSITTIISQTDKNGISYEVQTNPDNSQKGRILGIKIGARSISIGDTISINFGLYKITKISLEDNAIVLTYTNDNGNTDTINIKKLLTSSWSIFTKEEASLGNKLYEVQKALVNSTNDEALIKYIIDNWSDIEKLVNKQTLNIKVIDLQRTILVQIRNKAESVLAKASIKEKYGTKYNNTVGKFDFPTAIINTHKMISRAHFINKTLLKIDLSHINDFESISTDKNGNRITIRNKEKFDIINQIHDKLYKLADELFVIDPNVILKYENTFEITKFEGFTDTTLSKLNKTFDEILELSNDPEIQQIVKQAKIDVTTEFIQSVKNQISKYLKRYDEGAKYDGLVKYIHTLLKDSNLKDIENLISDALSYISIVNKISKAYIENSNISLDDVQEIANLHKKLYDIFNSKNLKDIITAIKNNYDIEVSNEIGNKLLTSQLKTYYGDYTNMHALYEASLVTTHMNQLDSNENQILDVLDLLSDIEDELDNISSATTELINESNRDINYILSDQAKSMINILYNLLTRMQLSTIYKFDTYDYKNVLLGLLQLKEGPTIVTNSYQVVFNVLRELFSNQSPLNIKTLIQIFDTSDVELSVDNKLLLDKLKYLSKTIVNPFNSLQDTTEYDKNSGSLAKGFIKKFLNENKVQLFDTIQHEGMRRLTPAIFSVMSDEKIFDANKQKFNTSTIDLFGESFGVEELFSEIKSFKEGDIFNVEKITIDDKEYFNIYKTTKSNKKLIVERIGLTDNDTYFNIPISQTTEKGTRYYSSIFGTEYGISDEVSNLINTNSKVYDIYREFYKLYTKYEPTNKIQNHTDELIHILNKLDSLGDKGIAAKQAIRNIVEKIHSNLVDNDNYLTKESIDTIYRVISPMFYNLRDVNTLQFSRLSIRTQYVRLNRKLLQDFNELERLKNRYELEDNVTVELNSINKSPILYTDRKTVNNLYKAVSADLDIDGKPTIEIMSKQPEPDGTISDVQSSIIISSLTKTEADSASSRAKSRIFKPGSYQELYVKVKANSGENGYSYIPVVRGTVTSNNDFSNERVKHGIQRSIINNMVSLFVHSDYTFSKNSSDSNAKAYYDILAALSDYIIVDEAKIGKEGSGYFKVGQKWNNQDGTFDKKIVVRIGESKEKSPHRLSVYEVSFNIKYDSNDKIKNIHVYKHLVTKKDGVTARELPVYDKDFEINGGTIKYDKEIHKGKKYSRHIITPTDDTNMGELISQLLEPIVGKLFRSVNTAWDNNSKSFGYGKVSYEAGEKGYKRIYTHIDNTQPYTLYGETFDNYQDFLIKTGAIQISAMGIKTEDGKILSNHSIHDDVPAMWFTNPNAKDVSENTKSKVTIESDSFKIESVIDKLLKSDDITEILLEDNNLIKFGIVPEDTSENAINVIKNLILDIQLKNEKPITCVKTSTSDNKILSYNNKTKQLKINSKNINKISSPGSFGSHMLHELLHAYMFLDVDSPQYNTLKSEIETIGKKLIEISKLTLDEFNEKYNANITKNEYDKFKNFTKIISGSKANIFQEVITYAFTDKDIAKILNNIKYESDSEQTNKSESFWSKLINTILKFIGIDIKDDSVLNEIRNILNNAYSITTNVEAEYEVGDKPTPLPAVTNDSVSDSVEEDDFDWNGDDYDNDVVILDNLENADREVGYTPALTIIENNVVKILQSQENLLSSTVENINDFKTKYTDALNQKIC